MDFSAGEDTGERCEERALEPGVGRKRAKRALGHGLIGTWRWPKASEASLGHGLIGPAL